MIERHFILDGIDPVGFYGAGNIHLQMLKKLHPKLRIVARDNIIKALGDDDELEPNSRTPTHNSNCVTFTLMRGT